jgi:hypothetical protein
MLLADQMSNWLDAHYKPDAAKWTKIAASLETDVDLHTY